MNRKDIKAATEDLIAISVWCSENLSHQRMKVGVAVQFYMLDFEGDPLASVLSDAGKWRHMKLIEEARTSRPPGAVTCATFKALTVDLTRKDRKVFKVLWPKFGDLRWNRGTLKTVVADLGTKLSRGVKSNNSKPDQARDDALEMIRVTAPNDALRFIPSTLGDPQGIRGENPCNTPCNSTPVTGVPPDSNRPLYPLILAEMRVSQTDKRPPPSPPPSPSPSPPPPDSELSPSLVGVSKIQIPEGLATAGLTPELLGQRIATRAGKPKTAIGWKMELTLLEAEVAEYGGDHVVDIFRLAISEGWTTCTPQIVRDRARKPDPARGRESNTRPAALGPSFDEQGEFDRRESEKRGMITKGVCPHCGFKTAEVGDGAWHKEFCSLCDTALFGETEEEKCAAIAEQERMMGHGSRIVNNL